MTKYYTIGLFLTFLICMFGGGHGGGMVIMLEPFLIIDFVKKGFEDKMIGFLLFTTLAGQISLVYGFFVKDAKRLITLTNIGLVCLNIVVIPMFIISIISMPIVTLIFCSPFLTISIIYLYKHPLINWKNQF